MTIAQFGKMAAKNTPGEGRSGHMIECIKNLVMQRGTCFPAPHRSYVSYLTILALIYGYGATFLSFGKNGAVLAQGAILAPLRDLGSAMGTLFPWRPSRRWVGWQNLRAECSRVQRNAILSADRHKAHAINKTSAAACLA